MNPHAWWDQPTSTVDDTNHQAVAPAPGPGHQHQAPGTTRTTRRRPPVTTHQIVADGEAELVDLVKTTSPDDAPAEKEHGALAEAWRGLRFVAESPGSLMDQIEYATEAAYTIREDGPWRFANIWFARLVAVPGLTLCYFFAWALFTRLSRTMTAIPAILLLAWVLNHLPVTAWAIPDWADITTWMSSADPTLPPGEGE